MGRLPLAVPYDPRYEETAPACSVNPLQRAIFHGLCRPIRRNKHRNHPRRNILYHFPKEVYEKNYGKVMARQMPVSLYGISVILKKEGISCEYVGNFEDNYAEKQIMEHLQKGSPVIIETSRMRRKSRRIVRFFDKKYAGSYHTMILLGVDEEGQVVFTDSATREWAGEVQRLKRADLSELISYMFPQKNTEDTHLYFSRKKNTGGYILLYQA